MKSISTPLNIFYQEPDPDRWLPGDRYARRALRRLLRGPARPGGHTRVFLNLCAGLDRIGVPYRVNDFAHARRHPEDLACVIGKAFLLEVHEWKNPIVLGPATFSHPFDQPNLLERWDIRRVLVPGPWMGTMCQPYWGDRLKVWPVGIDTDSWLPDTSERDLDFLVYVKVLWDKEQRAATLVEPLLDKLAARGLKSSTIVYGSYREDDYRALLARSRAMIFLCEHETQGIAYQQALSSGVPILAWDRQGAWLDPSYYPDKVDFGPVSSVPYFDERCGDRFASIGDFDRKLDIFLAALETGTYDPRSYVLENLTLEICARRYVEIFDEVKSEMCGS
ncbi:glycosyltransferase [Aurantiacibacter luteus]|uniref:glycosyltransferase n=1 Tax=Aurantiacibacter luteus TaxID=1581420 RepID=UPI0019D324FC|nr:glycosyltransferase [Aurantiacibacter luteus]